MLFIAITLWVSSNLHSITSRLNVTLFSIKVHAVTTRLALFEIDNRPFFITTMRKPSLLQNQTDPTLPDPRVEWSTRPVDNSVKQSVAVFFCKPILFMHGDK